jgi:biofilm PGA synthesis N-glycosyltransferase PgaC
MYWTAIFYWFFILIASYTFLGYAVLIYLLVLVKHNLQKKVLPTPEYEPPVTLVIPCFNEASIIENKILNCRMLDYPADKLSVLFITDGSTDRSTEMIQSHSGIRLLHEPDRAGKTAAGNRAMQFVTTPIVIFSDANTLLNREAIRNMVKHFTNDTVGCVSGEKRVLTKDIDNASAAGESIYWKYESLLKKLDSEFYSAVGAAGELVAFRSSLYKELPTDTLVDDFMQSMQIAAAGYKIVYEPNAFASEEASLNVKEELKRKIRIATGNWQTIQRLSGIVRLSKTPVLYFQYFSRRILRWAVVPFLLMFIFLLNIPLAVERDSFYRLLFFLQLLFYGIALVGYFLRDRNIRLKIFFAPYYFCVMHYAMLAGLVRFLSGKQNAAWDKAERKTSV